MKLKRLHITIYADTSYGEEEVEFMKQCTLFDAVRTFRQFRNT